MNPSAPLLLDKRQSSMMAIWFWAAAGSRDSKADHSRRVCARCHAPFCSPAASLAAGEPARGFRL